MTRLHTRCDSKVMIIDSQYGIYIWFVAKQHTDIMPIPDVSADHKKVCSGCQQLMHMQQVASTVLHSTLLHCSLPINLLVTNCQQPQELSITGRNGPRLHHVGNLGRHPRGQPQAHGMADPKVRAASTTAFSRQQVLLKSCVQCPQLCRLHEKVVGGHQCNWRQQEGGDAP